MSEIWGLKALDSYTELCHPRDFACYFSCGGVERGHIIPRTTCWPRQPASCLRAVYNFLGDEWHFLGVAYQFSLPPDHQYLNEDTSEHNLKQDVRDGAYG